MQKLTPRQIADQSEKIRRENDPDSILKAAELILYERGSSNARKAAQKLIEDPVTLGPLREFCNSLEKPAPIFSHATFFRIQDETDVSDNTLNRIAQILREDAGRFSIDPRLAEELKVQGKKMAPFMKVEEILFDGKDKAPRKRYLAYCPEVDKLEEFVRGQSKS